MINKIFKMANSPWGNGGEDTPPGGGGSGSGGRRPPNFDDLAGQFQEHLKKFSLKICLVAEDRYFYL